MYEGADVWREDWRKEMVWSLKMGVPTLPIRRLVFILRSFEQIPATIYRRTLAFLPGSGSQVECDVTHSKQTSAPFLPGSRIATYAFNAPRHLFSVFRAKHSVCAAKSSHFSSNPSAPFCRNFFYD
jgi:hypothetical protein